MGDVVPRFDPYNKRRALERIKKLWREGEFIILPHAKKEMANDDVTVLDVENIIRYGMITEVTQPRQLWRYRIEGSIVDRSKAACVIELDGRAILVTVFKIKRIGRQ
jgi:hypothetical protein